MDGFGGTSAELWPDEDAGFRSSDIDNLVAALLSDGDSRSALNEATGENKYLCPPLPTPGLLCLASCSASPISSTALRRVSRAFEDIASAESSALRATRLDRYAEDISARLLRCFEMEGLAEIALCPSGTDALLLAAARHATVRPGAAITALLPSAAETGTGVPLAISCKRFDGPDAGASLLDHAVKIVEIAVRDVSGAPLPAAAVNAAFAAAAAAADGRVIVYLTHGTKTGLIAPTVPPDNVEVVVDACQARISPAEVMAYVSRGWPVVMTGSKFYGGPAFSGAVFFPRGSARPSGWEGPGLGTVLRWLAALDAMEAFSVAARFVQPGGAASALREWGAALESLFATMPAIVPIGGLRARGTEWADQPSIFTFAIRHPADPARLLSAEELRKTYRQLARRGVLLGQPVDLGQFGGLRVAIGARTLLDGDMERAVARLGNALAVTV